MGMKVVFVLLLMQYSAHCVGFELVFGYPPEVLWDQMVDEIEEEEAELALPELKSYQNAHQHAYQHAYQSFETRRVPEHVPISAYSDQRSLLKPEWYARPLPQSIRKLLLATATPHHVTPEHHPHHHPHLRPHHHPHAPANSKPIEVLCHIDRIYVRVRTLLFTNPDAFKNLRMGSCVVNQGTPEHYYMLYLLKDCGTKMHSDKNSVIFTNKVSYLPAAPGPIVREMRFNIPLQCRYNRFHLSYKVGFMPELQGGTLFKPLAPKTGTTLDVFDLDGILLVHGQSYVVGQPMVFEAKATSGEGKQVVYVNKCFMTSSLDYYSMPKYTVIDNSGCMVDGKFSDQSKFMSVSTESTKFTISAFVFDHMDSSSTPMSLYMHCELSLGRPTPTASAKSCNYVNNRWVEVNGGYDHVCYCCDTTCPSVRPSGRSLITSKSLEVDNQKIKGKSLGKGVVVETVPELKMIKPGKSGRTMAGIQDDHDGLQEIWDKDY